MSCCCLVLLASEKEAWGVAGIVMFANDDAGLVNDITGETQVDTGDGGSADDSEAMSSSVGDGGLKLLRRRLYSKGVEMPMLLSDCSCCSCAAAMALELFALPRKAERTFSA